ncbi:MAG: hypothetical protein SFT92_02190 [Rickettsiales bacterium]|nr:hypothetical protein [Rickettsiales bacterium]
MTGILQNVSQNQRFLTEGGGFAVAEVMGAVVALGMVGVADKIAPNSMKAVTQAVAKHAIEPYLDQFEYGLGVVCKLEECKPDKTKTRMERAEGIARALTVFGVAWIPSLVAKIATRRGINQVCGLGDGAPWWNVLKANHHDVSLMLCDELPHYGSMLLLNTTHKGAAISDDMLRSITGMLEKMGMSKKTSHEMAMMAVVHELPNFIGFSTGLAKIAHDVYKPMSHVERLALQSSLSSPGLPSHS